MNSAAFNAGGHDSHRVRGISNATTVWDKAKARNNDSLKNSESVVETVAQRKRDDDFDQLKGLNESSNMASQVMGADNNSSITPLTYQSAVHAGNKGADGDAQHKKEDDFTAIKEILSSSAQNLDAGIGASEGIEMKEG